MASTSAPYQTAIRGKIIAIGPEKDFITSSGEPRKFTQLGLATREKAIKVFHYAPEKIRMIKEGNCVLIKNYNSRQDGHITLNSTSIMYMCANIDIPQAIIQDAKQLIHPPEARLVTIQEANASPVKSTVTLKGFITQDENVRSVNVGGRATAVRGMTLEDKTGKIRLSLWREKATSPIKIGDFVEATNLAITKFNSESTAGSTARTLIKVLDTPEELQTITVEGFLPDSDKYDMISADGTSYKIDPRILQENLNVNEQGLQDAIQSLLPWNIDVITSGLNITAFQMV